MIEFADKNIWTGRFDDEDGELGLRWHQIMQTSTFQHIERIEEPKIALLGFASDEGVRRNKGRIGAKNAPNAIRKSLANLPFNPAKQFPIVDFGNVVVADQDLESARNTQIECVSELLNLGYFPIILGGGHETALGDFLGLAKHHSNIGIINIDAHFDLRIPVENSTSGTPFFEMANYCAQEGRNFNYMCLGIQPFGNTLALFERAKELNVQSILADEIHENLDLSLESLNSFIAQHDVIYLSLDLDVFDGAFAPGVSAPSVNGLTPHQVKSFVNTILKSQKLKLFDVVELNPEFDQDQRTAKLAANIIQTLTLK